MERWVTAKTVIGMPFEAASSVLVSDPAALLPAGHRIHPDGGAVVTLSAGTRGGAELGQEVLLTLGAPCSAEGESWVPVEWEPVAHAQLLPSFRGVLELIEEADRTELAITGTYEIPLGVVGRFGDGLLGRRLAQQSVRTLLEGMARQLRGRVADGMAHAAWRPAPYPIDLRERPVPEPPGMRRLE